MEKIPCDPEFRDSDRCDVYRKIGRCFLDIHHLYHPRKSYATPEERAFRELDENKVETCRNIHNLDHVLFPAPDKPDSELMAAAVEEQKNRRAR